MNKGLAVSLAIAVLLVIGLTGRVIQLSINNYNLGKNYTSMQSRLNAEIGADQNQVNQSNCVYWMSYLHNGEQCPYAQGSSDTSGLEVNP